MEDTDDPRAFFEAQASTYPAASAPGEACRLLADGNLTSEGYRELVARYGLDRDPALRGLVLDWIIDYVRLALARGALATGYLPQVHRLKGILGVAEGEFVSRRSAAIKALLCEQLEVILEDGLLEEHEELAQLALQDAFDLGYDSYLGLTRPLYEMAIADLRQSLQTVRPDELAEVKARLKSLEVVCNLASAQRRSLGGLR